MKSQGSEIDKIIGNSLKLESVACEFVLVAQEFEMIKYRHTKPFFDSVVPVFCCCFFSDFVQSRKAIV